MPIQVATDIHPLSSVTLTSDGNNLTISWTTDADNGTVEIEARQTGDTSWSLTDSAPYDGGPITFTDLPANEEYEVRGRTVGNEDTSDWSDYETFLTLYLPIVDVAGTDDIDIDVIGSDDSEIVIQ